MIKDIFKSITITMVVAIIIAATCYYTLGYNYINTFICSILIQIVIFYIWNSILSFIMRVNLEKQETIRIEQYEKQGVEVNCAHCNALNFIPVSINDDNNFNCVQCEKTNAVYIDVTVAQKSDIPDKANLSVNSYIKEKVDATKQLK